MVEHKSALFHQMVKKNVFEIIEIDISFVEVTPGPAAYDNKRFLSNRHSAPKHSFGRRPPISLRQDPYVNTNPI